MEPGALIASGRDGDIFEFGPGLVLRKTRDGRSIEHEARIMTYAADHGYRVPKIHEVRADGSEIVMERIDGPVMMDAMLKQPWAMPRYASMLADLHDQLHAIPAPDWLRRAWSRGDDLVHFDLHPMNVLLSADGPVVVDWANAARDEGLSDVAASYVLLDLPDHAGPEGAGIAIQPVRLVLAKLFARRYRGRELNERIALAAEMKTLDPNMAPGEIANMQRLARRLS